MYSTERHVNESVVACRGSALLVGVGGTGKQSLARFAALVADCDVFTVNIRRGYNITNFREEIKQLFKVRACDKQAMVVQSPQAFYALSSQPAAWLTKRLLTSML